MYMMYLEQQCIWCNENNNVYDVFRTTVYWYIENGEKQYMYHRLSDGGPQV